ncbi:hypothetical protein D3C86_2054510 [compost metagenome]
MLGVRAGEDAAAFLADHHHLVDALFATQEGLVVLQGEVQGFEVGGDRQADVHYQGWAVQGDGASGDDLLRDNVAVT